MSIQLLHTFSSCGAGIMGWEGFGGFSLWCHVPAFGQKPVLGWPCLWAKVCALGLGIPCFCWERSVVCTWLVNTCMPYFGKVLSLFLPEDHLVCAYPPSFPYGSCCLAVTGIIVALNFWIQVVKKENKEEPQKKGRGKEGANKADACNILCIYPTLNF